MMADFVFKLSHCTNALNAIYRNNACICSFQWVSQESHHPSPGFYESWVKFCSEEMLCSSKCNITAIYIKVILPWIYSDMKRIRKTQFNFQSSGIIKMHWSKTLGNEITSLLEEKKLLFTLYSYSLQLFYTKLEINLWNQIEPPYLPYLNFTFYDCHSYVIYMDPKSSVCLYSSKPFPKQYSPPIYLLLLPLEWLIYDGKLSGNSWYFLSKEAVP